MRYFIIALFLIGSASADGLELEFSLMTAHLVTSGMNNNNALIGLSYDNWEASTFINSYGDRSYSASRRFHLNHGFSVSAGAIHGYGDNAKFFYARVDEAFLFASVNYDIPVNDHFGLRARLMGRAIVFNIVLSN